MTDRPALLLDCDPGHDDTVALVVAAHHADLVGVTTVSGNAPLADVTRNALAVAELFDLDVPVHAGCPRPLVAPARHAPAVHGESGLGGTSLPEPTRSAGTAHAVEHLIASTRARPGCWLVPVGPLTNIALALRLDPTLPDRIAGISLMGGGATTGNVTPTAEFNVWADPEAAAVVFEAGARVPVRMAGLDVTHQVRMHGEDGDRLRATGTERGAFLADLLAYYGRSGRGGAAAPAGSPMHDPLAVLAVTHPHLFTHARRPVHVELAGTTRGMTVVDTRPHAPADAATCDVAEAVDADAVRTLILDTLLAACA
ncbi:MAG: nucleoside hydrolase [Acidimicrobiales bacterium]|nr:nucleoside hydrolase [Acidimicrobiales bacterium]MCB1016453.1 nucleoside hydrolase [Acidimicrobiales bacterium]